MNQELEQYLRFFVNHKQKNQLEWLAIVKFMVNNKVYSTTKTSPFIANYGQELKIGVDIKRKEKIENVIKFVERIKKVQKEMKQHTDKERREVEE